MSKKVLIVDYDLCTGCHLCELVCSLHHEGIVNPYLSKISVLTKPENQTSVPVYCLQCNDAPCARACPVNAIKYDEKTSAWLIDYGRCIGCRECAYACPFGAISFNLSAEPIKCDLCGGSPQCVNVCPHEALIYGDEDKVIGELRRKKAKAVVYELYLKGAQALPGNRVREADEAVKTLYSIWEWRKKLKV